MVSGGERCADRMRGGVNGRNSVGPSILYEGLRSITRNYHSLAMGSGRDGRDQLLRRRINDVDGAVPRVTIDPYLFIRLINRENSRSVLFTWFSFQDLRPKALEKCLETVRLSRI